MSDSGAFYLDKRIDRFLNSRECYSSTQGFFRVRYLFYSFANFSRHLQSQSFLVRFSGMKTTFILHVTIKEF